MPHGITQCYLPPGGGDIPALNSAKAGLRSIKRPRRDARLSCCVCARWVGHINRMPDSRIREQIFFGQLATGKRPQSGPARRFEDVIKSHMKWCEINAADLCSASLNRTSWRTLCHKAAAKFEDARLSALEHRRAVWKFGAQPLNNPGAWPCSSCSRICNSRIGLYTHERTH